MAKSSKNPYMPTLTEQAENGYACMQKNFTTGQLSAINAKLKKVRGGRSRKEALAVNPWAVINDERKLNLASRVCETVEDVKDRIDYLYEFKEFHEHPAPIGDY